MKFCKEKYIYGSFTKISDALYIRPQYGVWNTACYPVQGMVEFQTGGWGLAPRSTYKGFYYSDDNTHKVFSAADISVVSLEMNGDYATWTDGTDNHGSSACIVDKWFWFEASF